VAADVLDEHQHLGAPEQRAAVHRARLAVDAVLLTQHGLEQAAQRALADAGTAGVGQLHLSSCDITSPNTVPWPQPVVTTRRAVRGLEVGHTAAGLDGRGTHLPVDLDRLRPRTESIRRWLRR
jgi:hypothetical protein